MLATSLRITWCVALVASVVAFPSDTHAQSFSIEWRDRRLSVVASGAPLATVLAEVARETNSQFAGLDRVSGHVSIEFRERTLRDGLRLLFADLDYVLMAPDGVEHGAKAWVRMSAAADANVNDAASANDSPAVDEPVGTVDPDDEQIRLLEASGFFRNGSVGPVVQAAQIGTAAVRARALNVLLERDPSMAAVGASSAIGDPHTKVNEAASAVIAQLDDTRAVEALGAALSSSEVTTRSTALELLALRNDPAALPYARQALNDEHPAIRLRATQLVEVLERLTNK